jgi:predicted outer membrane repeat protein
MSADTKFGSVVNALDEGGSLSVPVEIDTSAPGAGALGHPDDVKIEYAGTKKYYFAEDNEWKDRALLKITSRVKLAGADSVTSAYIVKNPPESSTPAEGAGFITTGGAGLHNTAMLFGGSYINLPPTSLVNTMDYEYSATNPGKETYLCPDPESPVTIENNKLSIEADFVVWGDLKPDMMERIILPAKGKGVTIWGGLEYENANSKLSILNNAPTEDADGNPIVYEFKDIPYIYIDQAVKALPTGNVAVRLGVVGETPTGSGKPLNIFTRSISIQSNVSVASLGGDLYLMDENANNVITPMNRGNNALYGWSSSVINKTSGNTAESHTGGSIYSKGNLTLSKMRIEGGVYCDKDLTLGPDLEINGNIACKGKLTINGKVDVKGPNVDIFVSDAPTITGEGLFINGIKYDSADGMSTLKAGFSYRENAVEEEFDSTRFEQASNTIYNYDVQTVHFDWGDELRVYNINHVDGIEWTGRVQALEEQAKADPDSVRAMTYKVVSRPDGTLLENPYNANEKYYITDDDYSYWNKENGERVTAAAAMTRYYNRVDSTGAVETPVVRLPYTDENRWSYFNPGGGHVSVTDAYDSKDLSSVSTLPYVYPPYAERDVVIGKDKLKVADPVTGTVTEVSTSETQVVKTLKQLYETINPYRSTVMPQDMRLQLERMSLGQPDSVTGEAFPTYSSARDVYEGCLTYADELKSDGTISYKTWEPSVMSNGSINNCLPVVTKSCILTGSFGAADQYKTAGGIERCLVFKPTGNMLVVLKDFNLESGYKLLVDDTLGGTVYFYIPGDQVIQGSETDVTDGLVVGNTSDRKAVKDLGNGSGASNVTVQEGFVTSSYNVLFNSNKDFQITTDTGYVVSTDTIEPKKQSSMIRYVDDKIDPPLLEQMHNVLGLKNKLGKPKIYVYGGNGSKIHEQNAKQQSVNILSAELQVSLNCSAAEFYNNHTIYYNGLKINDYKGDNPPGVIGCFNANTGGTENAILALYVKDGAGGGDDITTDDGINYRILYYDEY